eukprot:2267785-Pleurochrysis_carterae.AAC.2
MTIKKDVHCLRSVRSVEQVSCTRIHACMLRTYMRHRVLAGAACKMRSATHEHALDAQKHATHLRAVHTIKRKHALVHKIGVHERISNASVMARAAVCARLAIGSQNHFEHSPGVRASAQALLDLYKRARRCVRDGAHGDGRRMAGFLEPFM